MTTTMDEKEPLALTMKVGAQAPLAATSDPDWDEVKDMVLAVRPIKLPPKYERPSAE